MITMCTPINYVDHLAHSPGETNFNQARQSGEETVFKSQYHLWIHLTHMADEVIEGTTEHWVLEEKQQCERECAFARARARVCVCVCEGRHTWRSDSETRGRIVRRPSSTTCPDSSERFSEGCKQLYHSHHVVTVTFSYTALPSPL